MDHLIYLKPNNFSISQTKISLESNFIDGQKNADEIKSFSRCIQPIINEKRLEPAQITLF